MIEETKRSLHEALCMACNLIQVKAIIYGGGVAKISCCLIMEGIVDKIFGIQ